MFALEKKPINIVSDILPSECATMHDKFAVTPKYTSTQGKGAKRPSCYPFNDRYEKNDMSCGPHGSLTHAAVYALDEKVRAKKHDKKEGKKQAKMAKKEAKRRMKKRAESKRRRRQREQAKEAKRQAKKEAKRQAKKEKARAKKRLIRYTLILGPRFDPYHVRFKTRMTLTASWKNQSTQCWILGI